MRLWPWSRRSHPALADPDPGEYELAEWARQLAGSYRADPGWVAWQDTMLVPVITPAEEIRRRGGGGW